MTGGSSFAHRACHFPFEGRSRRGSMSRSVLRDGLAGSRVPLGTVLIRRKGFLQNVSRRVLIPVKYHATSMTDVCPNAETFLDDRATVGAFLAGRVRWHGNDRDVMQQAVSCHPLQEYCPSGIM